VLTRRPIVLTLEGQNGTMRFRAGHISGKKYEKCVYASQASYPMVVIMFHNCAFSISGFDLTGRNGSSVLF